MDKEAIDEVTEVSDTETIEEQRDDTQTESDTTIEFSDDDHPADVNGDDAQNDPESGEAETTPESEPAASHLYVLAEMEQRLSILQNMFEKQIARNQNQKQMFDTVYNEMKDYRENALLETYHKPVIYNLIRLYDNFVEVESQLKNIIETTESQTENSNPPLQSFETWFCDLDDKDRNRFLRRNKELATILETRPTNPQESQQYLQTNTELQNKLKNLEIVRIELEEVLYRMDVIPYEERLEKLDKKLHKTLGTIPTDDRDQDDEVAEVYKIGFYWREKVFRPEEVTIFRYKSPVDEPKETVDEEPTDEKPVGQPEETAVEKPTDETNETVGEKPTDEKGEKTDG